VGLWGRRYRADEGRYPERLDALVPRYLPHAYFDRDRPGRVATYYEWKQTGDGGYDFAFGYDGPGRNRCEHVRATVPPVWDCHGYY